MGTSRGGSGEDAAAIRDALDAHHRELRACIETHRGLCLAEVPDRTALAASRWRVAQAGRSRMTYLNRVVLPAVEAASTGTDLGMVVALRDATPAYQRRVSAYVTQWTTEAIVADWDRYRQVAEPFRQVILTRVSQEAAVLRPLLRRMAMMQREHG